MRQRGARSLCAHARRASASRGDDIIYDTTRASRQPIFAAATDRLFYYDVDFAASQAAGIFLAIIDAGGD